MTEHIADKKIGKLGEHQLEDRHIYQRDIGWLNESDVVVAEVTTPSLGVGYEIAMAERDEKPILCLHHKEDIRAISPMISGSRKLRLIGYKTPYELDSVFDEFFSNLVKNPNKTKRDV